MKRILLLFAFTFMVIGQTLSAREWTVSSVSSSNEAVFYVTLQDKGGTNVNPLANDFQLGAFVDGVCRGLGTAQYTTETTTSSCVFVFRIPVTSADADKTVANSPCMFEPDANSIFNSVLPLHLRSTMQEIFTESAASEQCARVMAMQTASDNARDLLDQLNLEYNKLRQESITTELLDIAGGQIDR